MNNELKFIPERYRNDVNELMTILEKYSNDERVSMSETAISLLNGKLLAPLTLDNDEWLVLEDRVINIRCPKVYRIKDKVYYDDAIVWVDKNKLSQGEKDIDGIKYNSKMIVKEFPFNPRTFYVETAQQLNEALGYYDKL